MFVHGQVHGYTCSRSSVGKEELAFRSNENGTIFYVYSTYNYTHVDTFNTTRGV